MPRPTTDQETGHLRDAGRVHLLVTLVFGLIPGFGFAADLLETRLPTEKLDEARAWIGE